MKFLNNNNKFRIVGIYKPLSTSLVDFNALFFDVFIENDRNKFMAIMGDFNIDTLALSFSNQGNQFLYEIKSLHFLPLINIPTRITEASATRAGQYLNTLYLNTVFKYIYCIYTLYLNTFFNLYLIAVFKYF